MRASAEPSSSAQGLCFVAHLHPLHSLADGRTGSLAGKGCGARNIVLRNMAARWSLQLATIEATDAEVARISARMQGKYDDISRQVEDTVKDSHRRSRAAEAEARRPVTAPAECNGPAGRQRRYSTAASSRRILGCTDDPHAPITPRLARLSNTVSPAARTDPFGRGV